MANVSTSAESNLIATTQMNKVREVDFVQRFTHNSLDKLIEAHRDMMTHVYGVRFGWDLSDERNVIAVYQRMGSMTGLMFYLIERGEKTDIDLLVRQVMADTQGDKEAPQ